MIQLHKPLEEGVGTFETFYKGVKNGEGAFQIHLPLLYLSWKAVVPLSFGILRELKKDFDSICEKLKLLGVKEIIVIDLLEERTFREFASLIRFHSFLGYTSSYLMFKKEV